MAGLEWNDYVDLLAAADAALGPGQPSPRPPGKTFRQIAARLAADNERTKSSVDAAIRLWIEHRHWGELSADEHFQITLRLQSGLNLAIGLRTLDRAVPGMPPPGPQTALLDFLLIESWHTWRSLPWISLAALRMAGETPRLGALYR